MAQRRKLQPISFPISFFAWTCACLTLDGFQSSKFSPTRARARTHTHICICQLECKSLSTPLVLLEAHQRGQKYWQSGFSQTAVRFGIRRHADGVAVTHFERGCCFTFYNFGRWSTSTEFHCKKMFTVTMSLNNSHPQCVRTVPLTLYLMQSPQIL